MKSFWIALALLASFGAAGHAEAANAPPVVEGGQCAGAIQAAQARYAVPTGLLYAIGQVESGQPDLATHRLVPWPWAVQAQNQSYYFPSKAAAVAWVEAAQAKGVLSIDVGCMQVNLMYHPTAFQNLDAAFDPAANADYAARFLLSLHAQTGDWQKAAGLYHSQTLALAIPYAQKVEDALNGRPFGGVALPPQKPTMLAMLQAAWGATMDGSVAATPTLDTMPDEALVPAPRTHVWRRHAHPSQSPVLPSPVLLSYEH